MKIFASRSHLVLILGLLRLLSVGFGRTLSRSYLDNLPIYARNSDWTPYGNHTDKELKRLRSIYSITLEDAGPAPSALEAVHQFHKRYSNDIPTGLELAAREAQSSYTIVATPEYSDRQYNCPITFGLAHLQMNLDTGSTTTWAFSKNQPPEQLKGRNYYGARGKPYNPPQTFRADYTSGDRWAVGDLLQDTITIGGLKVHDQMLGAATDVGPGRLTTNEEGMLGLGWDSYNFDPIIFNPDFNLGLKQYCFAAALKKRKPGTFDFGFVDKGKYTGPLDYVPVYKDPQDSWLIGAWAVKVNSYSVGVGPKIAAPFVTIVDTGTTLTYLDPPIVQAYYSQVSGARYDQTYYAYIFPCTSKLPNLSLYLPPMGHKATVPGSYLNAGKVTNELCMGGLQALTAQKPGVLGTTFLKSQYAVFVVVSKIGFAQQVGLPAN